jgi:O-antigen/teichoic acid export membrane protein
MLVRHSMIYMVAKLVPGLIGMATTALLTRLLRPDQYGAYGLALVIMLFGSSIGFDWLGIAFMRFYPAARGDPRVMATVACLFGAIVALTLLLATLAWAAGPHLGLHVGGQNAIWAAGLLLMWSTAWFELVARFDIAALRPRRYLIMNLARAVLILAGAGGGAWLSRNPVWAAGGAALGTALAASTHRVRGVPRGFDRKLAVQILRFGLPMAAGTTGISLVNAGTRFLIDVLDSPQALGFYTAGFMLVQNTLVVAASGMSAAGYALAVRAVDSGDREAARKQLLDNATLLLAVLAPAALGMALTAHGLAACLVGPTYVGIVARLTPWMAAAAFLASIRANYFDQAFQLGRRPGLYIWVTTAAGLLAILLGFVLIPAYGPRGAAMANCAAMATSCLLAWRLGSRAYPMPLPLAEAARILLACAAMALAVIAMPGAGRVALTARICAGAATYAAAALAVNVMNTRRTLLSTCRALASGL